MRRVHAKRDGEICRDEHQVDKELEYQLFLARDYGVLPREDWKSLTVETIEIQRMLCGLRRRILGDDDRGKA